MGTRFNIDYSEEVKMLSVNDLLEEVVIVLDIDQVEAIVEWYCKEFKRKLT